MLQPFRMANSEIRVRLQRAAGSTLPIDPVFGGPIGTIEQQYEATISLYGQPRFLREKELQAGPAGDTSYTRGYITFAARELFNNDINPPSRLENARIVGIKRLHNAAAEYDAVDFLITEVRARGHLTGGPVIYKAFFEKFKDIHGSSRSGI
jgi:hypothetical protein